MLYLVRTKGNCNYRWYCACFNGYCNGYWSRSSSSWNGGFRDWRFRGCIRNVSNIFRIAGGVAGLLVAALGPVAIALGVVAAAVGVGVLAYKGYQKQLRTVLLSDRFATNTEGKVSSSTKKVLGEYFKLSDGIRQKLTEMRLNHEVITEEQSQKLIGQYDKLGNTIIEKQMQDNKKKWRDLKVLCGFVCTDC